MRTLIAIAGLLVIVVAGLLITAAYRFSFRADGLVESVFTSARMREVDGRAIPTPWQGRFARYEERTGMTIPLAGEIEWLLPDGPQMYWRGEITGVDFE